MTVLSRFFKMIPNHHKPTLVPTGHHSRHHGTYQWLTSCNVLMKENDDEYWICCIGIIFFQLVWNCNWNWQLCEDQMFAQVSANTSTTKHTQVLQNVNFKKLKYVDKSNMAQSNVKSFYGRQNDLGLFFLPLSWYFIRISTPSGGCGGEPRCKRAVPWEIL